MLKFLCKDQFDAVDMLAMVVAGVLLAQGYFLLSVLLIAPKIYYVIEYWWKQAKRKSTAKQDS